MNYRFYIYPYVILRWQGQGMESMICLSISDFLCVSVVMGLERDVCVPRVATDTQEPD